MKTILNYGAVLYNSDEEALKGAISSHGAISDMIEDVGHAVLPSYGSLYMGDSVLMFSDGDSVTSLGQSNRGVNLVTDKPISMFLPIAPNCYIKGFTAWYYGPNITEECAVVRLGGDERNIGQWDVMLNGRRKRRWPRRTSAQGHRYDFDIEGHRLHALSAINRGDPNPDFVKNYGVHGVWVDYTEKDEHDSSSLHDMRISGKWSYVHTALKINKRDDSNQSMNTIEADLKLIGAKQIANISGLGMSRIKIDYQTQPLLEFKPDNPFHPTVEENALPIYEVSGGAMQWDVFTWDLHTNKMPRGVHNKKGQLHVRNLDLTGYNNLRNINPNEWYIFADFNDSILANHSSVVTLKGLKTEFS